MKKKREGISRRIFINRSVGTMGGVMFLTTAGSLPSWAREEYEGTFTRMGRLSRDPDTGCIWQSYLQVDMEVRDVTTRWGPTRVTEAVDRVMVERRGGEAVDVSRGSPDAKLNPRIEARGGRVCATWCGCHPETRQWRVFANYSRDGRTWTGPMTAAGARGQDMDRLRALGYIKGKGKSEGGIAAALNPSVALDEEGGAWIAYEDWSDGSIRLTYFNGSGWTEPIKISESGKNYRPKVIVTKRNGKHKGSVALAWDSYRNMQYDIYMRMVHPGGKPGPEMRVTRSPRWDSCPDVMEDLDGNLWVAWVRASNELSEMNAMRDIHVKFYDGERWFFPMPPKDMFELKDFKRVQRIMGLDRGAKPSDPDMIKFSGDKKDKDGRITWYSVNWFPRLQVDMRNRVYVFWRGGDHLLPPLYSHLEYRIYEGDCWTEERRIRLGRNINILRTMWDLSVVVGDREIEAIWDQGYLNIGKAFWTLAETDKVRLKDISGPRVKVQGEAYEESIHEPWPVRDTIRPHALMELDGKEMILLFGDTHTHSWTSDGADPADYYFHFARDYARLDFFALSDHDFMVCGTPGVEAYLAFLPKAFSTEEFICFQAYEFTSSAKGHRVVVFEGKDKPTFPLGVFNIPGGDKINTTGQMYRFMHRFAESPDERVLVTSHNMLRLGNDFSEYDESLEPLYDVTSLHMAAERTVEEYAAEDEFFGSSQVVGTVMNLSAFVSGGPGSRTPEKRWFTSWRECLEVGFPVGAYGASDTHAANAIGWVTAGLWVESKDRKSLFDAMFKKHSVALDNRLRTIDIWNTIPFSRTMRHDLPVLRLDIRFWLDEHFMGSTCSLDKPPLARVYVKGQNPDDPVARVVFVKDGKDEHFVKGSGGNKAEAEWRDESWNWGPHYYYVRAEFRSGTLGFSSPVFVRV
jgi:hypothetical protein